MATMETPNTSSENEIILEEQGKIPVIVKVMAFMISLVFVFTGIANLLPQVEGQAPKEVKVDLGSLTMDTYISMGEALFKGKGTCTLCHNNLGRAPDILVTDMEESAITRLKDPTYKGDAKDSESYFLESMLAPSKYVVAGYGKPGAPSSMPAIDKAPIQLSPIEMGAIIAFLQAKNGGKPSVELPTDTPPIAEKNTAKAEPVKPAESAEEVLTKNGCTACHAVLDSPSTLGPSLNNVGSRLTKAKIRESIIYPATVIAEGFPPIMPANFGDKMMVKELEMVVDYLFASKGSTAKEETKKKESSE